MPRSSGTYRNILIAVLITIVLSVGHVSYARIAMDTTKVLRLAGQEYTRFDPQLTGAAGQATVENALFRGLLRYDTNGNPAPSIAKEIPSVENGGISADGKTYTFHLSEWKWSDGKGIVTAQDFVYSFERLVDPKNASPYGSFLNGIVVNASEIQSGSKQPGELGVKAVEDKTFQVSLVKPTSFFNAIASMWILYVVRQDNVERAGLPKPDAWSDPAYGEVVGSGPFRLIEWDHNKKFVFEHNPNFSGSAPKLDRIEFTIFDEPTLAVSAYQNDELDIIGIPRGTFDAVVADETLKSQIKQYRVACTNYLAMDNTHPPFNNPKVREAFTYALDRDLREKVIDKGISTKQLSWLPEGVPGYDPELGKQYDFNAAKAAQSLADAGYPNGEGFPEVAFNYVGNTEGQRVADWYKEQFKQVLNIDIQLNPMEPASYTAAFDDVKNHFQGLFEYGWCADYLHPSNWLQLVFGTGQPNNVMGYSNTEFDRVSKAADTELDPEKAMAQYKQAHEMLIADFPVIFLNTPTAIRLVKPRVQNLTPNSLDGGMIGGFFWEDIDIAQ